jgi:hypothetical protein
MQSLVLSNMDETVSGWGIALMRLQADLPDTLPGQNVTVLLFGDVEIEDAGGDTPMQAFTFRSGIGDAPCEAAPDSGILIQTPEGAAEVTLVINEAKIILGSTVYLRAVAGEAMTIAVIGGQATVMAFDTTVTVPAGMSASVPIDENRVVSGPPNEAETTPVGLVEDLAPVLAVLPEPIIPPGSSESTTGGTTVQNQQTCTVTAAGNVNLRSGPGTVYGRSGGIAAGDSKNPVGQAVGVDGYVWWQLSNGSWVRADVVNAAGSCDKLPSTTDVPPTPTPAPQGAASPSGGGGTAYGVIECAFANNVPATAGKRVQFYMGIHTTDLSEAETRLLTATFTVDGVPLSLFYEGPFWEVIRNEAGWSYVVKSNWTAASGTHTIVGDWSYDTDYFPRVCTFTVE